MLKAESATLRLSSALSSDGGFGLKSGPTHSDSLERCEKTIQYRNRRGGISGLTLAITLLEYNIDLTIYEAASHFGEIGAGVALGPNAGRAMETMSPKIYNAFLKCKTDNMWESKQDSWFTIRVGDVRKANKDGFVKAGKKVGDALFDVPLTGTGGRGGIYRAQFLDELIKEIPEDKAKFDKRLDDLNEAEDGSGDMVLHFTDGSTAQHSAVIACDVRLSRLIPMDEACKLLGDEVAQNSQMFFGYHGHLLTFPIQQGKVMNVVAFNSRKSWDNDKWVVTTSKEEMAADFADWGDHVQKIVGAMQKPDVWALFMHPPCETYTRGRVCLLGDAAHATTPHQGSGAGMCIEDAFIMAGLIKEMNSVDELQRAFKAFEQVRIERTQKLITTSHEAGMLYDFELVGDDLDKLEENLLNRMGWIWNLDLEQQLNEARKIFHGESAKI
ncbi:mannitol 1-phosphate dehydrogenase [Phaeosphaeriaceae sp. PMI808]|nr:mannitol 1-phosphate dehydrogenase [Phaeosphaeriaceae sp. PMI808]